MGPLVSPTELSDRLYDLVPPTVLDVRYRMGEKHGWADWEHRHIAGAAYVDLDADLASTPGPRGRHPLPDPEVFGAAMRRCGVSSDRPVVVYDDWHGRAAARCWWLLRHHGHDDVRVLDGGFTAWRAIRGDVVEGEEAIAPGDFEPLVPGRLPVVDVDHVLAVRTLVDARDPERYRGDHEPVDPVAGHIPGAVNAPTGGNLDADGRFLPAEQLAARYREVGITDPTGTAVYCGSGVTAAHDLLALEAAGLTGVALYPGSWSEWVADASRPVATSARP